MTETIRILRGGGSAAVHANRGLRKVCGCARAKWAKCAHPWHFNYRWKGEDYRLSLNRHLNRVELSKTEAEREAETLRIAIRAGTFRQTVESPPGQPPTGDPMTFEAFAAVWKERRGFQLVQASTNTYRLGTICRLAIQGVNFGAKPANAITTTDVETLRHCRLVAGKSVITVNHDLKLLRKMFAWGIREGLLDRTPFRGATGQATIKLGKEPSRSKRLESEEQEQQLLAAAEPHLHDVIVAMLETCARPGEVLSLQWKDIDLAHGRLKIRGVNAKDRQDRMIPITARLAAILDMRKLDPSGELFGPDAFVFGDELGRKKRRVREAWERARIKAGLGDFHLADLRHEAASSWEENGVGTHVVSKLLGHSNLKTTSIYINANERQLHHAARRIDEIRAVAALAKSLQSAEKLSDVEPPSQEASADAKTFPC